MTLGEEWELSDLASTFHNLCNPSTQIENAPKYCWIDQLCIAQDDDSEVRETLAKIPDIYRTFDVAVLFPGSCCECVPSRMEALSQLSKTQIPNEELLDAMLSMSCPNDLNFCTWGQRIWPRQEFLYSKSVRIVWSSLRPSRCPVWWNEHNEDGQHEISSSDLDTLSPVSRLWFERFREIQARGSKNSSFAQQLLRYQSTTSLSNYAHNISLWLEYHAVDASFKDFSHERFSLGLLGGERIQLDDDDRKNMDDFLQREGNDNFLRVLSDLRTSERKATKEKDYILSVWVDCPGYKIPADYSNITAASLLEDAIKQFERHTGSTLLTYTPSGLFGPAAEPAHWRPTKYLDHSKIDAIGTVYGPMLPFRCPLSESLSPNGITGGILLAQYDHRPLDVQEYQANNTGGSVLDLLVSALPSWHPGVGSLMNCVYSMEKDTLTGTPEDPSEALYRTIVSYIITERQGELPGLIKEASSRSAVDTYSIVLRIVAHALALTAEAVQQTGLRLMMRPSRADSRLMLGLTSYEFSQRNSLTSSAVSLHLCKSENECTQDDDCESLNVPPVVYEFADRGDPEKPRGVLGVWAPVDTMMYERS
ncbi:MAG: hypothetical protein M1831_003465 [Alyxoria varia]|nr:MAG: hypothetical protein M1831_003465 [Alyxoria varia]